MGNFGRELSEIGKHLTDYDIAVDNNGDFAIPIGYVESGERKWNHYDYPSVDKLKATIKQLEEARKEATLASKQWDAVN